MYTDTRQLNFPVKCAAKSITSVTLKIYISGRRYMILYCLILNICRSDVGVSLKFPKNAEFLDIGQVNPRKRFIVQKSIPLYLKMYKTG